jgi:hypothetical protein
MLYIGSHAVSVDEGLLDWLITHRKADCSRFLSPQKHLTVALAALLPPSRIRWMIRRKIAAFVDTETPRYFHLAVPYPGDQVIEILELLLASGEPLRPPFLTHVVASAKDPRVTVQWLVGHGCVFQEGALDKVPLRIRDGWSVGQCIELTQWLMDEFSLEMTSAYYIEALRWSHKTPVEQLLRWALPYCRPHGEYISKQVKDHRQWYGKLKDSLVDLLLVPSPVKIA